MERLSPGDRGIAETWKPAPPPGEKSEATKEELNFDAPWPDRVSFKDDPEIAILLDGDTFESLQEQIAKGLRRYRVKLTFREGY